jgi:hypothetical protein
MELRCYEDGRPLSPDERAILAVRSATLPASTGGADTQPATREYALFHVDCFPDSGEWVRVREGQAGLLHDTPP